MTNYNFDNSSPLLRSIQDKIREQVASRGGPAVEEGSTTASIVERPATPATPTTGEAPADDVAERIAQRVATNIAAFSVDPEDLASRVFNAPVMQTPDSSVASMETLTPLDELLAGSQTRAAIPSVPLQMPLTGIDFTAGAQPVEEVQIPEEGQTPPADRMTGEQRSALSNMPDVLGALGQKVFTDEGRFSRSLLDTAVENAIGDPLKRGVFLGTMQKEVQDSGPINENYYNNPSQITSPNFHSPAWVGRLKADGLLDSQGNPTSLYSGPNVFNSVYANRGGNGNFASGDGDRYRGRGLIQLTFRDNYEAVNEILNDNGIDVDIVSNPDLVNDPQYALPVAMAYLQYAGLDDETLTELGPEKLNNIVNKGAPTSIARERWGYIVESLRDAGQDELAESMSYRDEFNAQETVGTVADGVIGPNSVRAMREWLNNNNIEIPEGSTAYDLVELVNRNS